jgi:HEAT repeat protein
VKDPGDGLSHKNGMCRLMALGYMWRHGDVDGLLSGLTSPKPDVQAGAYERLERIMAHRPGKVQIRTLVAGLKRYRDATTQIKIIKLLTINPRLCGRRALRNKLRPVLKHILSPNTSFSVKERRMAAEALGYLKDKASIPTLLATLKNDPDQTVQREAVRALVAINDPSVASAIIEAAHMAEAKFSATIDDTLIEASDAWSMEEKDPMTEAELADHHDHYTRDAVDRMAKTHPDAKLYMELIRAVGHFNVAGKNTTDVLRSALASNAWPVRKAAASTLASLDAENAVSILKEAVEAEKKTYPVWNRFFRVDTMKGSLKEARWTADRSEMLAFVAIRHKLNQTQTKEERLRIVGGLAKYARKGSDRALKLLMKLTYREGEFTEVSDAAQRILDSYPVRVAQIVDPKYEASQAFSGPDDIDGVVRNQPVLG